MRCRMSLASCPLVTPYTKSRLKRRKNRFTAIGTRFICKMPSTVCLNTWCTGSNSKGDYLSLEPFCAQPENAMIVAEPLSLLSLAAEYGLSLVFYSPFADIFQDEQENPEFKELMKKMKVINDEGESAMDEDMFEAVNLYVCFAFTKT